MKRLLVLGFLCLAVCGCENFKGDKGDTGLPGGTGEVGIVSGVVTGDLMNVFSGDITLPASISVYLKDPSVSQIELPYFLPGLGVNAYYLIFPGKVQIFNAQLAGATSYEIYIVKE